LPFILKYKPMYQLIFCSCPDHDSAEKLAKRLITDKLAACVNILPGLTSIYQWQGQLETAQEHLLLIKSRSDRFAELETAITTHHPYQVPEIIAVDIQNGTPPYLNWIDTCLATC